MMNLVARVTRKLEYRYLPTFYRNTLGWRKNRYYSKFCNDMREIYRQDKGKVESFFEVSRIKKEHLGVLDCVDCSSLAEQIAKHFRDVEQSVYSLPQSIASSYTEDVFRILKAIDPKLRSFYRSFYSPFWIQIQKNNPGITEAGSAFQWHTDDNPIGVMKVFVYLNDVTESNGAFRAFPKKSTRWLFFKGFRSNGIETRVSAQPLVERFYLKHPTKLRILEGGIGTVLGFDNNLVHKGTLPREGFRHVIQILLYPSNKPLNQDNVRRALLSDRTKDYPIDPYEELCG